MSSLVQNLTTSILMDIGIDPSLIGYDCLKEAVPMVYENREYLRKLTAMLYPEVAQRLGSTPRRHSATLILMSLRATSGM